MVSDSKGVAVVVASVPSDSKVVTVVVAVLVVSGLVSFLSSKYLFSGFTCMGCGIFLLLEYFSSIVKLST